MFLRRSRLQASDEKASVGLSVLTKNLLLSVQYALNSAGGKEVGCQKSNYKATDRLRTSHEAPLKSLRSETLGMVVCCQCGHCNKIKTIGVCGLEPPAHPCTMYAGHPAYTTATAIMLGMLGVITRARGCVCVWWGWWCYAPCTLPAVPAVPTVPTVPTKTRLECSI